MPSGRGSRAAIDTQSRFRKRSALNAEMVSSHKRVKDSPQGKEFDTYKVGTTANSTSTMHKLASTPITLDCFETDDYSQSIINEIETGLPTDMVYELIQNLEELRLKYLETKDKRYWKELVRWLPNGWLQTRTVTMNYETLINIYYARRTHKLAEWHTMCDLIMSLPYAKDIIAVKEEE